LRLNFARFHKSMVLSVQTLLLKNLTRSLSLLGLLVVLIAAGLIFRPDWRSVSEWQLLSWLQNRQVSLSGFAMGNKPTDRVTAQNPQELPKEQAEVVQFLSKKYRVAPEPISAIVSHAFETGKRANVDPMLLLAVMAVESGFNPYAQSSQGAQGLMQVMTKVHVEKYDGFGGKLAAFDPLSNLRVGAKVLAECLGKADGDVTEALRYYVGAPTGSGKDDGGYPVKVMAEQQRLIDASTGKSALQAAKKSPDGAASEL
jgi:soluble lytic murein transglycosylase-like protein